MSMRRCILGAALLLAAMTGQQSLAALTGQYLFESNTLDSSGFGRDGALNSSPSFTTGLYKNSNNAMLFDGASQNVLLPASTDEAANAEAAKAEFSDDK